MPRADGDLFSELVGSGARSRRNRQGLVVSLLAHAGVLASVLLLPLFAHERAPEFRSEGLRVFLPYDPPPPPPPPLPLGPGLAPRAVPRAAATPAPVATPDLVAPSAPTVVSAPEPVEPSRDPAGGDPTGSLGGDPAGMPGGVIGGVVGGVPGGVLGGVIGGTGTGTGPVPVISPDRPPRALRMTRPQYPRDAFVAKREGTVVLEILIDDQGHVARVRVVRSVPLLDQAAIDAVHSWLFAPAIHAGRPVASLAEAPISFRIY